MDILELPALPAVTALEDTWRILIRARRSGLITDKGSGSVLVGAGDVLIAQHKGRRTLRGVGGVEIVKLKAPWLPSAPPTPKAHDWIGLMRKLGRRHERLPYNVHFEKQFSSMLEIIGVEGAGVVEVRAGSAIILTGQESTAARYSVAPRRCYCTNPFVTHDFDNGTTGEACPNCTYPLVCGP